MTELARLFKALGDDNRLRILAALARHNYSVCDLARELGLSQPTISHHLKILRDTGLVTGQKDGQWIFCSLNEHVFAACGLSLPCLLRRYEEITAKKLADERSVPGIASRA